MSARYLAYKILFDIEVNGNYSNMALNKYLNEAGLDDQDKGFVTELVYGIIEKQGVQNQGQEDATLCKVSPEDGSLPVGIYGRCD